MPKIETPPQDPKMKLVQDLFESFKGHYVLLATKSKDEPMLFSQMNVVAISQLAAVLAVDVGMQPDQFLNVCRCNFEEAFKQAPRFA